MKRVGFLAAIAAGATLMAQSAAVAAETDLCEQALRAVPGKTCVANAHGAVLGVSQGEADRLAAYLAAGELRFRRHFGTPPPPYALVQGGAGAEVRALREAGFARVLPWFTPERHQEMALASVRRGVEQQIPAGASEEARRTLVEAAEQAWREANPPSRRHANEAGAVPHELGHVWYIELYWPDAGLDGNSHYGGPGPDWLDETSAVLMEDEVMTRERWDQFRGIYQGDAAIAERAGIGVADLIDLPLFLAREHPMSRIQRELLQRAAGGNGRDGDVSMTILTGEEARRVAAGAGLFYLQSRAFADFLVDRSGSPAIFADIGAAFGRGETIEQWLAANGEANRIGSTVAELERIWLQWLDARFGPPGG